mmetsp:Transcript_14969/g.36651  ORF Transcript_14969/g.36651 Transcript_14969/m.36651 type:complete len:80 (-) Transcript_14969:249-488(-)
MAVSVSAEAGDLDLRARNNSVIQGQEDNFATYTDDSLPSWILLPGKNQGKMTLQIPAGHKSIFDGLVRIDGASIWMLVI